MSKATLTALAWRQSWILWAIVYGVGLALGFAIGYWQGLLIAALTVTILQIIRAYWRLAHILDQLESRAINPQTQGLGVWSALETLIYRKHRDSRQRLARLVEMLRGYRLAANAMPEGALVVNRHTGTIIWSNKVGKRMLTISPGDESVNLFRLLEAPVKTWFNESDAERPLLNITAPNNSEAFLDLFLLPYTETHSLIILRDSTKMRRLEQMRSDFVANVSHELRTPLTVIHGYLELIEQQDNTELATIIAEMQKQSSRMNNLVEDLLNLSRLESENTLAEEAPISSGALLHTLQQEAQALSHGRHHITVDAGFNGHLIGSPKDIHSAFSNLVSNAIRYTAAGGSVRIGLSGDGQQGVDFYVIDTGFGIPADHISRLTERFYRVSTSRSRELGGTGLGLSIAKHVLNLHQAELVIKSIPGKGSEFRCRFPPQRVACSALSHSQSPA
jgi:two-component system, OmpR family, phosphate regulon sensor histidine kinase PhoR